jgi:uncharacterized protein
LKVWPVVGIVFVQTFLCLGHWFLYYTWTKFWWPLGAAARFDLKAVLIVLAASLITAALLSLRYTNWFVTVIYRIAAIWLGLLNFLFVAACLSWITDFALRLISPDRVYLAARPYVAGVLVLTAVGASIYGVLNARWIRVRRVTVRLPNLPASWRGRRAIVFSDVHLGNINRARIAQRIARMVQRLKPEIIFIPGDLFDGSKDDPVQLAAPLFELKPPLGIYYVLGNHDEFGGGHRYTEVLRQGGMHVLDNERVTVDGLSIVGVSYHDSTYPMHLRNLLQNLRLSENPASILLQHVPYHLAIVEQAGVSLQISGHTHGGQIFPFSWVTHRAFGRFTYGLQQHGALQVYTSSGAGTWGPPMRVGTHPEVVLLTFA